MLSEAQSFDLLLTVSPREGVLAGGPIREGSLGERRGRGEVLGGREEGEGPLGSLPSTPLPSELRIPLLPPPPLLSLPVGTTFCPFLGPFWVDFKNTLLTF